MSRQVNINKNKTFCEKGLQVFCSLNGVFLFPWASPFLGKQKPTPANHHPIGKDCKWYMSGIYLSKQVIIYHPPGEPKTFIFGGYDPYIEGLKPKTYIFHGFGVQRHHLFFGNQRSNHWSLTIIFPNKNWRQGAVMPGRRRQQLADLSDRQTRGARGELRNVLSPT